MARDAGLVLVLEDSLERRQVGVDAVLDGAACELGHDGRDAGEFDFGFELDDGGVVLASELVAVEERRRPGGGADGELVRLLAGDDLELLGGAAAPKTCMGRLFAPVVVWAQHDEPFVAAVENGPLTAMQLRPELSGDAGATVLTRWVDSLKPENRA